MGGKTLALYIGTTAVAITLALTIGNLFQPGAGADLTAASSFKSADAFFGPSNHRHVPNQPYSGNG